MTTARVPGWRNERQGIFAHTGWGGLTIVGLASLPWWAAMVVQQWLAALIGFMFWLTVAGLVMGHFRERSLGRWMLEAGRHVTGKMLGVTQFEAKAASGEVTEESLEEFDLPGILQGFSVHDGTPMSRQRMQRPALLQHKSGIWVMTARVEHEGLRMSDSGAVGRFSEALCATVRSVVKSQSGMTALSLYARSMPDDGAERAAWVQEHQSADIPDSLASSLVQLERQVLSSSGLTEYYVSVTFSESKIAKLAKGSGGGVAGRAAVMYRALHGIESNLADAGCGAVTWLTAPELAAAIRTGFNPGAAVPLAVARVLADRGADIQPGVHPGAAGPSHAPAAQARSYRHDGYVSVSYSLVLPDTETRVGQLRPLLRTRVAGERRSLALHFEPAEISEGRTMVDRDASKAMLADEVKRQKGFKISLTSTRKRQQLLQQEKRLAEGELLVRIAGAASVTVEADSDYETSATLFEGAALQSGFQLMRLELAQPAGFVASTLPVGIGLPRRGK